jgi:hypothetical protein
MTGRGEGGSLVLFLHVVELLLNLLAQLSVGLQYTQQGSMSVCNVLFGRAH